MLRHPEIPLVASVGGPWTIRHITPIVDRVELGDHPVVAVRLLDGAAAAHQPAVLVGHKVHGRRAQRQPGRDEGRQADTWRRGGGGRHPQAAAMALGVGVDAARQVAHALLDLEWAAAHGLVEAVASAQREGGGAR